MTISTSFYSHFIAPLIILCQARAYLIQFTELQFWSSLHCTLTWFCTTITNGAKNCLARKWIKVTFSRVNQKYAPHNFWTKFVVGKMNFERNWHGTAVSTYQIFQSNLDWPWEGGSMFRSRNWDQNEMLCFNLNNEVQKMSKRFRIKNRTVKNLVLGVFFFYLEIINCLYKLLHLVC